MTRPITLTIPLALDTRAPAARLESPPTNPITPAPPIWRALPDYAALDRARWLAAALPEQIERADPDDAAHLAKLCHDLASAREMLSIRDPQELGPDHMRVLRDLHHRATLRAPTGHAFSQRPLPVWLRVEAARIAPARTCLDRGLCVVAMDIQRTTYGRAPLAVTTYLHSPYAQALPDGLEMASATWSLSPTVLLSELADALRRVGLPRHAEDLSAAWTDPASALRLTLAALPDSSPRPSDLHTLEDARADMAWALTQMEGAPNA